MTSDKKDKSILIRLTSEEKDTIKQAADGQKVSVSEYVRTKLFEQPITVRQNDEYIEEHIQTLKEQNRYLQEQNVYLQGQNKSFQHEQLDILQKLLLLNTPKVEPIEEELTKQPFFKRLLSNRKRGN